MCVRRLNGSLIAAAFGMNRLQYVTIPRKLDTSSGVDGGSAFFIASTFAWVGETPFPLKCSPKNSISSLPNSHFSKLRVRFLLISLFKTFSRFESCSSFVFPVTKMSSLLFTTPGIPLTVWRITSSKISAAQFIPKFSLL